MIAKGGCSQIASLFCIRGNRGFYSHLDSTLIQFAHRASDSVHRGCGSGLIHPRGVSHDGRIENGVLQIYSPYMANAFPLLCKWSCSWQVTILISKLSDALPDGLLWAAMATFDRSFARLLSSRA